MPEAAKTFPDPTKPAIKRVHERLGWSWIIFIAFNALLPFVFALVYIWMNRG